MFNDALEESQFIKLCFSIAWASGLFMIMPLMGMQGVAGNTVRTTRIDGLSDYGSFFFIFAMIS